MEEIKKEGATWAARYVKRLVCEVCHGDKEVLVYIGGSDRECQYEKRKCDACNGTGMVKQESVVNVFPFDKL